MTPEDAEEEISALLDTYPGSALLRRPMVALRVHRMLGLLPVLICELSGTTEAHMIRTALHRRFLGLTPRTHEAKALLALPTEAGRYAQGRRRATLRRKARRARLLGVTCRPVTSGVEREALLALANESEKMTTRGMYRNPSPRNGDLIEIGLWLAAYHDGHPILLSVTPVDGHWALLRYFRTMTHSEEASTARYLMTEVLAEKLVELGVLYLCDGITPFHLPPGLRHFARMVGFRIHRVLLV